MNLQNINIELNPCEIKNAINLQKSFFLFVTIFLIKIDFNFKKTKNQYNLFLNLNIFKEGYKIF